MALDNRNKLSIGVSPGFIQQSYTPNHTWEDRGKAVFRNKLRNWLKFVSTVDISTGVFYQHSETRMLHGGAA